MNNSDPIQFTVPAIVAIDERSAGNVIQQVIQPSFSMNVVLEPYSAHQIQGYRIRPVDCDEQQILAITNPNAGPPVEFSQVLRLRLHQTQSNKEHIVEQLKKACWLKHPHLTCIPQYPIDYNKRTQEVVDSWWNSFSYIQENSKTNTPGLRPPQIGAIHAAHSHWTVTGQTATIVMPTGTGKTETMLSLLVSTPCPRLLVIVPTDTLRTQIANKFLTLGILKDLGVIAPHAQYPIVGILRRRPKTGEEVDEFFTKCNVIVTTMHVAGQASLDVQERMAHHCPYLFIDEAHHIAARTWKEFRARFESNAILQFTATPFRNDAKPIGGKIIYNYPLSKAQKEGYFRPINYKPITIFDLTKADQEIAEAAVAQLREDRKQFNHLLMARVGNVKRAEEVLKIYQQYSEFEAVALHSGISSTQERENIRQKVIKGEAQIVVCVDMLGEGFDLPQLKIAAFHDIRKSLAVTLQLAGRFTRTQKSLGDPTFIANIGDTQVSEELRKLYTQDADWNLLLPQKSMATIQEQIDLWEFLEGFHNFPDDIPLQQIRPALSTVVYKTKCDDWQPEMFEDGLVGIDSYERINYDINYEMNTLVAVTAKKIPIKWAQVKELYNWVWELYILYWDQNQNLLFVHGSNNEGHYEDLAQAVAGKEQAELITGGPIFRSLAKINRLKLQNVGLIQLLGRLIRFTMRVGADIEPVLTDIQKQRAQKSNLFGVGFEDGYRTSIGCSYKGRIWSRQVTNIEHWTKWCSSVGRKLLDETIDPNEILKGTHLPILVSERPQKMPYGIDWHEDIYLQPETAITFVIEEEDVSFPIYLTDINLIQPTTDAELKFEICSEDTHIECILEILIQGDIREYRFRVADNKKVSVRIASRSCSLEEFLYVYPPTIHFVDGSYLSGNNYVELQGTLPAYPGEKIVEWDWMGTDIRRESQGTSKRSDSIQYKVIETLKQENYLVIFDDDDAGEAADVVTVSIDDTDIIVEFYHCKFSSEDQPGARVKDLYEVCGQAQKSIKWKEKPSELFTHLLRREERRTERGEASRLAQGTINDLMTLKERAKIQLCNMRIFIVQPGLSRLRVSDEQLALLGVTQNYLAETFQLPLGVIASS